MIKSVELTIIDDTALFYVEDESSCFKFFTLLELQRKLADDLYGHPIYFSYKELSEEEQEREQNKSKILKKLEQIQYSSKSMIRELNKQGKLLMMQNKSLEKQLQWINRMIELEQKDNRDSSKEIKLNINRRIKEEYLKHFDKRIYERIPLFDAAIELMALYEYGAPTALREANKINEFIPKDNFDNSEATILQGFYSYRNKKNGSK